MGRQYFAAKISGFAGVAQSVEQLIRNEKVGCSIHLSGTTLKPRTLSWCAGFFRSYCVRIQLWATATPWQVARRPSSARGLRIERATSGTH
jgi:hypothetical protein